MINTQYSLPQISIGESPAQAPQSSLTAPQQDPNTSVSIFPSTTTKSDHEQKKTGPLSPGGDEPFTLTPEEEATIQENFNRVKEQWDREKRSSAALVNPARGYNFPLMGPPGYDYNLPPFNTPEYRRNFAGQSSHPPQSDHTNDPSHPSG